MIKRILAISLVILFTSPVIFADDVPGDEKSYKTGKQELYEIYEIRPEWREAGMKYFPNPDDVKYLQNVLGLINIKVYFGFWCDDSIKNIPRFLRLMQLVGSDSYMLEFWSVGPEKKGDVRIAPDGRKLKRVPTFVVFFEGKEAGEIVENPLVSLENDLANILMKVYKEE